MYQQLERDICQIHTDKKIKLSNQLTSTTIYTDRQLLFRVLENLLQNAIRFAVCQIDITMDEDEHFFYFRIKDDGEGFSPAAIEQGIPFFCTSEKEKGHFGIGLGICNILCKKLGGSLSIGNNQTGGAFALAKIKK